MNNRHWARPSNYVFFLMLLCSAAITQLFRCPPLSAQEATCRDVLRVSLRPRERGDKDDLRAREFLWEHWSKKQCADLFQTTWSREGVKSEFHYHISPSERNTVRLTVNFSSLKDSSAVQGLAVPASGTVEVPVPGPGSYEAYIVERVRREDPNATAIAISGVAYLPPSKYRLRFKDKDGKLITDF
jgi:hypothetical protein